MRTTRQTILWPIMAMALLLTLPGCDYLETDAPSDAQDDAVQARQEYEQAKQDLQKAEARLASMREATVQRFQNRLEELDARLDSFRVQAEHKTGEEQARLMATIERIEAKRELAEERIDALADASDTTWDDLEQAARQAMNSLEEAFSESGSQFS